MTDIQEQKRIYMREYARARRASDPVYLEKCREAARKYRQKNKDVANQRSAEWRASNKEKIAEYNKEYTTKNKEKIKIKRNLYQAEAHEKIAKTAKAWQEKNKEYIKSYNQQYTAKRYQEDIIFRLKINQRSRTRAVLKSTKECSTNKLLGCSFQELKSHIESLFVDGMNWDNMGMWHIDHIIPLAAFDLTLEENQKLAFNYKNLQPLWAIDNLKKGARYA